MFCPEFTDSLAKYKNLKQLDFSNNNLTYLPPNIQDAKQLTKVWINGNRFICDCSMLWMARWIANFTLPSGENVIQGYKEIMCLENDKDKRQIYQLNPVEMGCFPERMPSWEIALLTVTGIVVISIAVLIIILFKKREGIKFRLLRDKGESLEGKKFDALIAYRYVTIKATNKPPPPLNINFSFMTKTLEKDMFLFVMQKRRETCLFQWFQS